MSITPRGSLLSFYSPGSQEQDTLCYSFFFPIFVQVSLEDRTHLGGKHMESMLNTEDAEQLVVPAEWEWVRGFVQNADVDSPQRQQCKTTALLSHPLETKQVETVYTCSLHLSISGQQQDSISISLCRAFSCVPHVQPCHYHQLSRVECLLPFFTWKAGNNSY